MQILNLELEFDFRLIGISCHVKDYKMAWLLNKALHYSLERKDDLEIPQKSKSSKHTLYTTINEDDRIYIHLIANRSENGYLLPERAQLDYLMKIEQAEHLDTEEIQALLRRIPQVQFVSELDVQSLKSKENLLF